MLGTLAREIKTTAPQEAKTLDAGAMEGYASVYGNVDRVGDRVLPGAFGTQPFSLPLLAYHDAKMPIGGAVCTPDELGLHVTAVLANTAAAQDVRQLMKIGAIPAMSFGYRVTEGTPNNHGGMDIKRCDAMEVSVVPIPCNPSARILGAKAFAHLFPPIVDDLAIKLLEVELELVGSAVSTSIRSRQLEVGLGLLQSELAAL